MQTEIRTCTACPLHTSAITNCMPGRGPNGAEMLLVAQGPGGAEDMTGEVLVGPSGQLLDQMLLDAGIDPATTFKTNATRCRAPYDRAPTPAEIDACREHLAAEIHAQRPKVIVALGDTALRALCKKSGVQSKRGQSFPLHESFGYACEVYPTYHPAFVLRAPQARHVVVSDLRRVRDRLKPEEALQWAWFDPSKAYVISEPPYAWDIETYDADGNITDDATQFALAFRDGVIVFPQEDLRHHFASVFGSQFAPAFSPDLVTHNGWEFDIPVMHRNGIYVPWGRDTMVLAYLDDETQPRGLESLCVKYLGVRGWKEGQTAPLGSDEFAEYNARDAAYTLQLYGVLLERLGERVRIADHIMLPLRQALNACTDRGVYVNQAAVDAARDHYLVVQSEARAKATELANIPSGFNPGSNPQVAAVLGARGYPLGTTPTGAAKVDKATLHYIDDPFADAVLEYRTATKMLSTYVKPYAAAKDRDNRVHAYYGMFQLTGRTSASNADKGPWKNCGTNVQNLPRKHKDFFGAPEGKALVSADYGAIEFRIAAWVAGESFILSNYQKDENWDPHLDFATRFYQHEAIQTATLLALQYGVPTNRVGAEVLRKVLLFSAREGVEARTVFSDLFGTGGSGVGELSPQTGSGASRVSPWDELVQTLTQEELRAVRSYREVHGWHEGEAHYELGSASSGPLGQAREQSPFQHSDAVQALSWATSLGGRTTFLEAFPEWKLRRQVAKSALFSQLYLGQAGTLQEYAAGMGIELNWHTCNQLHRAFHRIYPGFVPFYRRVMEEMQTHGYVESVTGRRRHFGDVRLMNKTTRAEALREAVNFKVQSPALDIAALGLAEAHKRGLPINLFVHDSVSVEVDVGDAEQAGEILRRCLLDGPRTALAEHFNITIGVPLTVDVSVTKGTSP